MRVCSIFQYTFSECVGICKILKMILTFLNIGKLFDGLPWWLNSKESTFSVGSLSWEDPLEKGMASHSSILAWAIP